MPASPRPATLPPHRTGERLLPYLSTRTPPLLQHGLMAYAQAVYHFIAQYCDQKRVLNVNSGTGYGTAILQAHSTGQVWGTDIPPAIVAFAAQYYPSFALRLLVGNPVCLPIATAQFDVVTAVELIEWVPSADALLAEVTRVLRSDGLCLLSTPNRLVVAPGNQTRRSRPYVQRFTYAELHTLLERFFCQVQIFSIHITKRAYLVRYARPALCSIPPFPFAHLEHYLAWRVPPWNRARVGLQDVSITPHYSPHCFGFLAVCARPINSQQHPAS